MRTLFARWLCAWLWLVAGWSLAAEPNETGTAGTGAAHGKTAVEKTGDHKPGGQALADWEREVIRELELLEQLDLLENMDVVEDLPLLQQAGGGR